MKQWWDRGSSLIVLMPKRKETVHSWRKTCYTTSKQSRLMVRDIDRSSWRSSWRSWVRRVETSMKQIWHRNCRRSRSLYYASVSQLYTRSTPKSKQWCQNTKVKPKKYKSYQPAQSPTEKHRALKYLLLSLEGPNRYRRTSQSKPRRQVESLTSARRKSTASSGTHQSRCRQGDIKLAHVTQIRLRRGRPRLHLVLVSITTQS